MKPRLLDISRLVSRMGRGPLTGIDRVELAYFREFLDHPQTAFFLCRLPRSYAILDAEGGMILFNKIKGVTGHTSGIVKQATGAAGKFRQVQQAFKIAKVSLKTCQEKGLRDCLYSIFPDGIDYFNVGHSNLRQVVFKALKKLQNSKIIVLIHDIIPISYPEYSRPEVTLRFRADLLRVSLYADRAIYISKATKKATEALFQQFGRVPEGRVAHLAIDRVDKAQGFESATKKPSFVTIGTIEPRKNHALLLDIWQSMQGDLPDGEIPDLHIIGQRGWNNESIFNRLDSNSHVKSKVHEHNNLTDSEVRLMLAQSWALLFPSFIEGFGLPLVEAASCGVPIICGENAVYREILGDYPLYLNVDNSYLWKQGILERAGRQRESEVERKVRGGSVNLTDWKEHFDRIFRFI